MTSITLKEKKKYGRFELLFCFVLLALNVIDFVYNRLKQRLQKMLNRLLHISFFIGLLCLILCYMWRLGYDFTAMFVMLVCISYLVSQIYVNRTRKTILVLREEKLTFYKFLYFLASAMYESSIFFTNIMVCINLVLNYVFFWFWVMSVRLSLDLSKTWIGDNNKWLIINNYRMAPWHISPKIDEEQGINKLRS